MKPPDDEFREYVARRAFQIAAADGDQGDAEAELAELLDEILAGFRAAGVDDETEMLEDESDFLSALQVWLSVASYPVAVFYAPQSPFKKWTQKTLAGIAPAVANRVAQIAAALKPKLSQLIGQSGIDEVSVSCQFPWGLGGGVAWDVNRGSVRVPPLTYPLVRTVRFPTATTGHEFDIELDAQTTVTAVSIS